MTINRKDLVPFGGMARITKKGDFSRATANLYLLQFPDIPQSMKADQFKELLTNELKLKQNEIKSFGKSAENVYKKNVLKTFKIQL